MFLNTVLREDYETLIPDFRSKFGLSLDQIGEDVSLDEAFHLIKSLASDPSSLYGAKVSGSKRRWTHPEMWLAASIGISTKGEAMVPVAPWLNDTKDETTTFEESQREPLTDQEMADVLARYLPSESVSDSEGAILDEEAFAEPDDAHET